MILMIFNIQILKCFVSFCFPFRTVNLRTRALRMQHKTVNFKPAQEN